MRLVVRFCLVFVLFVVFAGISNGQSSSPGSSLRVFLDCEYGCHDDFLRDELPIVDFIREPNEADVHILYVRQGTAGGGFRATLTFVGRRDYGAMADTLTYSQPASSTNDSDRRALVHHLTIGLARFLARAGMGDRITIAAVKPEVGVSSANSIERDPWNYWAFTLGGNGSLRGQASTKFSYRRANFSANRTTQDLKIRFNGSLYDTRNEFDTSEEVITSTTNSKALNGLVVRSLGPHWSVGGTAAATASSFENTRLQIKAGPAIEYDFFPYSESASRLLTIQYQVTVARRLYDHLTIFALEEETILQHSLQAVLTFTQKWGNLQFSSELNHLVSNFDRSLLDSYNLGFYVYGSVRLFRGLSLSGNVSYTRIRDQIDLPATAATKEEILLQAIKLPTGYSYYAYWTLTYRFGSIYNNVVNPRMTGGM